MGQVAGSAAVVSFSTVGEHGKGPIYTAFLYQCVTS